MPETKQTFEFYKYISDHQSRYHNHKEVCAWSALVLQVGVTGISLTAYSKSAVISPWFVTFVVVAFSAVIAWFMRLQLRAKDQGAAATAVALIGMREILSKDGAELLPYLEANVPPDGPQSFHSSLCLPKYVEEHKKDILREASGHTSQLALVLYSLLIILAVTAILPWWLQKG